VTVISAAVDALGGGLPPPFPSFSARPTLGISILLIGIGLFLVVRALMSLAVPIGDLMQAVGRVADGDYAARAVERGPRDVRSLARAFNAMAERLQATDEQRRNLLADVTHELRTPLTVIQGNLEGLIDGVYPRDDAHLTPILDETRILSRLIDDLRTLALAESGALKLTKESADLGALIAETVASFAPQAQAAQVDLSAEVAHDIIVELDPARIKQVLENVIANALRYTPRGGTVKVKGLIEGMEVREAAVTIIDSGPGIPAQDLSHIFERFYKSTDSRGMGLGLAIAKNLIAAHGGRISAESELGHGTRIRFSLPMPN
jgi:signal transduction histidine kinase